MSQTNGTPRQGGRKPSSMDTPYQFREENHPLHGHATALVDDLFDAGLAGGKRSHKGQYVRWMLGKVRGDREDENENPVPGEGAYRNPYAKDRRRDPEYAGWSPDMWEGKFPAFNPSLVAEANRSDFVQQLVANKRGKTVVRKKAVAPAPAVAPAVAPAPARPARPAPKFPKGVPLTQKQMDEAIIHLFTTEHLSTRAILKRLHDDYGLTTSQPTITRRIKAFNDGVIDATGKKL
jgi:hypothetical protein